MLVAQSKDDISKDKDSKKNAAEEIVVESSETHSASEADSQDIGVDASSGDAVEVSSWEDKYQALEKDFMYLRAEFENYKRNAIKDRSQLTKYGAQRLAQDLLDTVDVFSQALETDVTKENFQNFVDGVRMTKQQLEQTLDRHGIKEVEVIGKNFDPANQEALGTETTDEFESGQVCRVFKAPFMYHDKLLRAGQVFVAQPKSTAVKENPE